MARPRKRPNTAAAILSRKRISSPTPTISSDVLDAVQYHQLNTTEDNLTFDKLVKSLEPNPSAIAPIWMKHIDRSNQLFLFYQLDTNFNPPRLLKSVTLNYRKITLQSGFIKSVLCPTVFIIDEQVTNVRIREIIGRSYIHFVADLTNLLEHIDECTTAEARVDRNDLIRTSVNNFAAQTRKRKVRSLNEDEESSEERSSSSDSYTRPKRPSLTPRRTLSRSSVISSVVAVKPRPVTSTKRKSNFRRNKPFGTRSRNKPRPKTSGDVPANLKGVAAQAASPIIPASIVPTPVIVPPQFPPATIHTLQFQSPRRSCIVELQTRPLRASSESPNNAGGEAVLQRMVHYRQIAARILGVDIDDELGVLTRSHIIEINKIFRKEAQLKDTVWKARVSESRLGIRPLRVWEQFKAMYTVFSTNQALLNAVTMVYVRDFLVKLSDDDAIDVMRRCAEEMSVEPLRLGYREYSTRDRPTPSRSGNRGGRRSRAESTTSGISTTTRLNGFEWDDSVAGPSGS